MKRIRFDSRGATHIVLTAVVVVVAAVAFAGYRVVNTQPKQDAQPTAAAPVAVPEIKTQADVKAASEMLDAASADIDKTLDSGQLDADLNDLL